MDVIRIGLVDAAVVSILAYQGTGLGFRDESHHDFIERQIGLRELRQLQRRGACVAYVALAAAMVQA